MKWLTIDYIKEHSRIDSNAENNLLELYGSAAEEMCLNTMNRTYENLIAKYGSVPDPVKQASLMLVDLSYMQRSPISAVNMSAVPYTFDFLIKPYMKLTDDEEEESGNFVPTVMLDIPYSIDGEEVNLDWSEYSFDEIKAYFDNSVNLIVRCVPTGALTDTFYFFQQGVIQDNVLEFSANGISFQNIFAILTRSDIEPAGKGDIVCEVVNSGQ